MIIKASQLIFLFPAVTFCSFAGATSNGALFEDEGYFVSLRGNQASLICDVEEYQCDSKGKKVFICHRAGPDKYETLCVSANNQGHTKHPDDRCGQCESAERPTEPPTRPPTSFPTVDRTSLPTNSPSETPSTHPTPLPTVSPSKNPTVIPSEAPTAMPSDRPSKDDIASKFIKNSVALDLPAMIGTEEEEGTEIFVNATFLEAGVISMAASYELIESIECGPGKIEIRFSEVPAPDMINEMFPLDSVAVVDGITFGLTCYLGDDPEVNPPLGESGFLHVEEAWSDGNVVFVVGVEGSYFSMFETFEMEGTPLPGLEGRRNLQNLIQFDRKLSATYPNEDAFIKVTTSLRCWGSVGITTWSVKLKKSGSLRYVEVTARITSQFEVEVDMSVTLQIIANLLDDEFSLDILKIALRGIQLPRFVTIPVNFFLPDDFEITPRLGLFVVVPAVLDYKLRLRAAWTWTSKVTASTGAQNFDLTVKVPYKLGSIRNLLKLPVVLLPSVTPLPGGQYSLTAQHTPPNDPQVDTDMELLIFTGFKPRVELTVLGLALVGVGRYIGIDTFMKLPLEGEPYDPVPKGGAVLGDDCDECHNFQLKADKVVRTNHLAYKILKWKDEIVLPPELNDVSAIGTWCYDADEDYEVCTDTCCEKLANGDNACGPDRPDLIPVGSCKADTPAPTFSESTAPSFSPTPGPTPGPTQGSTPGPTPILTEVSGQPSDSPSTAPTV